MSGKSLLLIVDLIKCADEYENNNSMRLSSIKLAGFKSFVESSKIPFPDAMTCVVGPNGCGKSNVIDAVRWVLGESSAKNLRGDAMADVIFNGSTSRKPISQASVELMFDNTAGRLPGTLAERNQISIKRLVTRDGLSQYFLNGSKCRKRDITDIFLGTGLGPRSYAIIEQGMISRLIESKPQDLRIFLEEAAGVSKYKERRRETETRLRSTRDNLERLLDLKGELDSQLETLSVQAQAAKSYKELKQQERALRGFVCVLKWQALQQKLVETNDKIDELTSEIAFLESAHSGHHDVIASLKLKIEQQLDELNTLQEDEFTTRNTVSRIEQQKIHLTERKSQLLAAQAKHNQSEQDYRETQTQLSEQITQLTEDVEISQEQVLTGEMELEAAEEQLALKREEHDSHYLAQQKTVQQHASVRQDIASNEQTLLAKKMQLEALEERQRTNQQRVTELKTELSELNIENLSKRQHEVKARLAKAQLLSAKISEQKLANETQQGKLKSAYNEAYEAHRQADIKSKTLKELLSDSEAESGNIIMQLDVQPNWQLAIENSLFALRDAHVVDSWPGFDNSMAVWPQGSQKIADSLANHVINGVYPNYFNCILAIADSEVDDVTPICEQLSQSTQFMMAVTTNGTLIGENWVLPAQLDQNSSLLAKRSQLADLLTHLPVLENNYLDLATQIDEVEAQLNDINVQMKQADSEVHQLAQQDVRLQTEYAIALEKSDKLAKQQQEVELICQQLAADKDVVSSEMEPIELKLKALHTDMEQQTKLNEENELAFHRSKMESYQLGQQFELAKNQIHKYQLHLESCKNQLQVQQAKQQATNEALAQLNHTFEENQAALEEVLESQMEIEQSLLDDHEKLAQQVFIKEQKQTELEQTKSALQDKEKGQGVEHNKLQELSNKKQKLILEQQSFQIKSDAELSPLADLNITLKEAIATLPHDAKLAPYTNKLKTVGNEINALGAINLAAIEEFDKAQQRKAYLDQQYDDLTQALTTLENAIIKIDRETKSRFKTTFDKVNSGLQSLFPKVFGGGSAYLELTSDDLLDTGVAIMARPPGKKNSTIHLLSGGEKALTALSLVFSIFQLNPAPFCMLDEVDAPLDDANVGRFCRLVKEMSEEVQFIYISHNKIAMEMAARLTGVTMAEPGVSRVVAVDIETALEMAQAS